MDFTPFGTSSYGTDQIMSNAYGDGGMQYDEVMTNAKIHQRKQPLYRDELELLKKARMSKDLIDKSAEIPTPEPVVTSEGFKFQRQQQYNNSYQRSNVAEMCNIDEMSMFMILIVILVIVGVFMYKRFSITCSELKSLSLISERQYHQQHQQQQQQQHAIINTSGNTSGNSLDLTASSPGLKSGISS